jgi:hypothetical protein
MTSTVYKLTFSHCARFAIAKKDFLPSVSIQAGTTRLPSWTTSVMPKRTRGSASGEVRNEGPSREGDGPVSDSDCPICFEPFTARGERTMARPFQCTHPICRSCDHRMCRQEDNRCPTCRAPRKGFTAAQAEPPADRFGPTMEELLQDSLPPELQGLFSNGAFADRLMEHASALARRRGTQQTIMFHVQSPVEWGAMPHEIAQHLDGRVAAERDDAPEASFDPSHVHVIPLGRGLGSRELTGVMPGHLLEALVNVPSVSLAEWRRRAAAHGTERGAPRPTPPVPPAPPQPRRGRFSRSFGFATRAAR